MSSFKSRFLRIIQAIWEKQLLRDIILMIFFSLLSLIFGTIQFYVPGIEGALSDLREIPLLVSVFHLSNPFYTIGMSAIASLGTPADGSYISTFLMHSVSLFISWYFSNSLKKKNLSTLISGFIWFSYIFAYYLILLLPALVVTNYMVGLNVDKDFKSFYKELVEAIRFEMITSSIITSLYLVQHNFRMDLKSHMNNLEEVVIERTSELNTVIEELKATQQYLIQTEKMASLGTLASGLAHEINNPLNFISGGIHLLHEVQEEVDKLKSKDLSKKYETVDKLLSEGLFRATGIVKALMTFSYKGESKLINSDIHEIIENTILFMNFRVPDHVKITKNYHLNKPIPLYTEKMHQILINVLNNAIYELDLDKNKLGLIIIGTYEEDGFGVIKVSNSGNGIPESQINQIFDPFFTTKEPGKGIGLGLSITYALVLEHNGKIHAENDLNGVSFIIKLPLNQ